MACCLFIANLVATLVIFYQWYSSPSHHCYLYDYMSLYKTTLTQSSQNKMDQESKVHGVNMGPIWVLSAPDGPHVGPMNLAIRGCHSPDFAKCIINMLILSHLHILLSAWLPPNTSNPSLTPVWSASHRKQLISICLSLTTITQDMNKHELEYIRGRDHMFG